MVRTDNGAKRGRLGCGPASVPRVSAPVPTRDLRRGDIQGLRALAVLAVIGFHAAGWPQAGWLGVDVFLVVSGYVITATLLRRSERAGRVPVLDFYLRRARRILPQALLVIGSVVLVAPFLYAEARVAEIRADGLWSALFLGNVRFWQTGSDYFTATDSPSPLLHFWSLAVEEQFYWVYPVLVLLVAGGALATGALASARRRLQVVLAVVLVTSLAWAWQQSVADPVAAYYSPLTRAWELALGCVLASLGSAVGAGAAGAHRGRPGHSSLPALLSWLGTAGVLAAVLLTPDSLAAPAPAAVVACLATGLVLAGGGRNLLLDNPVARWVGDLSYALYLWHLPVLVMGPRVWGAGARGVVVALGVTLLLAALSHYLVERPLMRLPLTRDRGAWRAWRSRHRRSVGLAAASTLLLAVALPVSAAVAPGWWRPSEPAPPVTAPAPPAHRIPDESTATTDPPEPDAEAATTTEPPAEAAPTTKAPKPARTEKSAEPPADDPTAGAVDPDAQPEQPGLGETGRALQDGLRGGLALTYWPGEMYPGPGGGDGEAAPWMAGMGCDKTDVPDRNACAWGRPDGEEIVVYGDSLGINLTAAVVEAYAEDYRVRALTKIACAVNGVDANFGQPEWRVPCDDHRFAVIDYVKEHRPRALIMTEHYNWSIKLLSGAEGAARERQWTEADQAFVDEIAPYVEDIILVAPSIPGGEFKDCYVPGGSPASCTTPIPDWFTSTLEAETRVRGVTFVDTRHWYCVDGLCPVLSTIGPTGVTRVKTDYVHVSYAYDVLLAEDLRWRLDAMGVGL